MSNGEQRVIDSLEDTTKRLPIRVHTDGTASVLVSGSKGDTYTLTFGQNDFDSCTCTCKGWTYSGKCYHRTQLIARLRGQAPKARSTRANRQPRQRNLVPKIEVMPQAEPVASMSYVGSRVRSFRIAKKMTQAQLAKACGMDRPNISRLEGGKHTPNMTTVQKVASALGVSISKLMG